MSKQTLTTPITMENLRKIEVVDVTDHDLDTDGYCELRIQIRGSGNLLYGEYTAVARNVSNSTRVFVNPASVAYGDKIAAGQADIPNARDTIMAAYSGAAGNKSAKRDAALAAARSIDLVGAGLASA